MSYRNIERRAAKETAQASEAATGQSSGQVEVPPPSLSSPSADQLSDPERPARLN
jgi:hypothetical protein